MGQQVITAYFKPRDLRAAINAARPFAGPASGPGLGLHGRSDAIMITGAGLHRGACEARCPAESGHGSPLAGGHDCFIPLGQVRQILALLDRDAEIASMRDVGAALVFEVGAARLTVSVEPGIDMVPMQPPKEEPDAPAVEVDGAELGAAVRFVAQAVAPDADRWGLNGLAVYTESGHLWVVATDGYRAHWRSLPATGDIPAGRVLLAPDGAAMLARASGPTRLVLSGGFWRVTVGTASYSLAGLEGEFPDWRLVASPARTWSLTLRQSDWGRLMRGALMTHGDKGHDPSVVLEASGHEIVSTSEAPGVCSVVDRAPVDRTGPAPRLRCNPRYLEEAGSFPLGNDVMMLVTGGAIPGPVLIGPVEQPESGVAPWGALVMSQNDANAPAPAKKGKGK